MKITKNALKRIINEELSKVLKEQEGEANALEGSFLMKLLQFPTGEQKPPTLQCLFEPWPRSPGSHDSYDASERNDQRTRGTIGYKGRATEAEEALRKGFQEVITNFPGNSEQVDIDSGTFSKLAPLILAAIDPGDPSGVINGVSFMGPAGTLTLEDILLGFEKNLFEFNLQRISYKSTGKEQPYGNTYEQTDGWQSSEPVRSGSRGIRLPSRKKK